MNFIMVLAKTSFLVNIRMGCLLLECVLAKDDFRKACFHVHVSESKHITFLFH